jgi:PilZ domain
MLPLPSPSERGEPEQRPSRMSIKRRQEPALAEPLLPRRKRALLDHVKPKIVPDRRRFRRVPIRIAGRFMREDKRDYPCEVINMSAGGMNLLSPVGCEIGERIVAYLDHFGRIEAVVARPVDGGFAAEIVASLHKREKIANQLTWLINRDRLGLSEERRHDRIIPRNPSSKLILPNGEVHSCRVIDVSLSGASIVSDVRPPIGTAVILGRMRGRVARHHGQGMGIHFADLQDPDSLARSFG